MRYVAIKTHEIKKAIEEFQSGRLRLYTKKNAGDLVQLTCHSDVTRYMFRLFVKEDG